MNVITILFITLGSLMILAMLYYVILYQQSRIYPPKHIVRARAVSLGGVGGVLLSVGFLILFFIK
ncbi:hypothetical protein ACFSCZ_11375 [Siminovitchia sediminis]|uniref:Uncharacterized protein n=1 Tax=Siminovitchia sediminis TaxID=1274353 RepID=A0ABW4KJA0_9BACI